MAVAPKPKSRPKSNQSVSEEEALALINAGGNPATTKKVATQAKGKKKYVQLRLTETTVASIKELADADRRSMHFWIEDAIQQKLSQSKR